MFPRNAASPEPIAIGAVVQISDGAVQTSGVTVRIKPIGVAEGDGGGTTAYSTDGIVEYTPTQAETNYTSFILIAKKTGCIPVSITVVTSASATPGYAGTDQGKIANPTTTVALTGTTIATTQKVDVETIKTNPVVNAGTITFPTTATLASTTNITGGTITTVTNLTNLPAITANWLTATGIQDGAITAAKIADAAIDAATFAADVDAEILSYLVDDATRIDASALNTLSSHDPGEAIMGTTDLGTGTGLTGIPRTYQLQVDVQQPIVRSSTSNIIRVWLRDSTTGQAITTLDHTSPGLLIKYRLETSSASVSYSADSSTLETISTLGTYQAPSMLKARFKHAANGEYEIHFADSSWTTAAKYAYLSIYGATNLQSYQAIVNIVDDSPYVAKPSNFTAMLIDGDGGLPWNSDWDAEVQSEVNDALVAHRLDELLNADSDIDGAAPPTVGSVFHELMSASTGSFTFDQTTDSNEALRNRGDAAWTTATGFSTLDASGIRTAIGMSAADLDGQLAALPTAGENASQVRTELAAELALIDVAISTRLATAGYTTPPTVSQIWTTALTEAYRATGATGTAAQLLYEILANIINSSFSGLTKTATKLDKSTTAKTYTVDADPPTSIEETT